MMQTLAIWRNVPNSMVCAIHKFKKLCCKCHRLGRFHETFKSKRSRGAHKGNLHTMLTCTLRSKRCTGAANNSKYSQGLLHIHAFCLSILCLCICFCIRLCLHECMHPGCPLLNLAILPRSSYFSELLGGWRHFSTRDSSHK